MPCSMTQLSSGLPQAQLRCEAVAVRPAFGMPDDDRVLISCQQKLAHGLDIVLHLNESCTLHRIALEEPRVFSHAASSVC